MNETANVLMFRTGLDSTMTDTVAYD